MTLLILALLILPILVLRLSRRVASFDRKYDQIYNSEFNKKNHDTAITC